MAMTLESWLEADENRELCNMAGDIAWDAVAGYHEARDIAVPVTAMQCKEMAADIAFDGRSGWTYRAADDNDPAGEIAKGVLAKLGFRVATGSIGFDATLAPAI